VFDDAYRRVLFTVNGIVKPTLLVDGSVAGHVTLSANRSSAAVDVTPLRSLSARVVSSVEGEALRLLAFTHPGLDHEVRVGSL
jgi:hypothetical protein